MKNSCRLGINFVFKLICGCVIEKKTSLHACLLLPNIRCSENYSSMLIKIENGKYLFKKMERYSTDQNCNFSSMLSHDHKDDGEYDNA